MRLIDLTDQRFGRLIVIGRAEDHFTPGGQRVPRWRCRCDCGKEVVKKGVALRTGNTKSCGCYAKDFPSHKSHGETGTRLYKEWQRMKRRCNNERADDYPDYGGKGVRVCDEWSAYEPFRDWSLANGYAPHLEIDRIENSKGYSPDNCRWATRIQQANNKTTNVFYEYNGKRQTIAEWAREYELTYPTLYIRLRRHHMPIEAALHKTYSEYSKGERL